MSNFGISLDQIFTNYAKVDQLTMDIQDRRKRGAAEIAAELRREISAGNLLNKDRLPPERQLSDSFGVARGTIREALNQLAASGYVEVRPGSGTYVTYEGDASDLSVITAANPLELMDARFALEPHLCRLAVLNGRRHDFAVLENLCLKMEKSSQDPSSFSEADTEFHRALSRCTGNGLLIWMLDQITSVRSQDDWTRMRHLTLNQEMIARYNIQHSRLLDALRAREPERAANIMKEHLETARLSLTRAVET
jgi:DNA-binding FadR family transcriptional regulator